VHQKLEGGKIFADPLAVTVLGEEARAIIAEAAADPTQRPMRLFIAARSRFAEDCLSAAVSRGVRQAVVLGAGLDTFSLRNPHAPLGLRVFEVDHPATQAWKRERLMREGLAIPASLTFAPLDFEQQSLADGLRAAGFQSDRPAFLGVVPYLTRDAISATFSFIASLPESEVVFDYSEPIENYPSERRTNVAAIGEPWLSHFDPNELSRELHARGFRELEDLGLGDIFVRFFGIPRGEAKGGPGPHMSGRDASHEDSSFVSSGFTCDSVGCPLDTGPVCTFAEDRRPSANCRGTRHHSASETHLSCPRCAKLILGANSCWQRALQQLCPCRG